MATSKRKSSKKPAKKQSKKKRPKGYIVYREVSDNGPNGSRSAYVRVSKPEPGETIYHGQFRSTQVACGQYDSSSRTEYVPVGKVTKETYAGGSETF